MSYPEQRKRERKMAQLNAQGRHAESLKLYLDARVPCREVWEAYRGIVQALEDIAFRARRIREDKAVVGIEASFIEQIASAVLGGGKEKK